MGPATRLHESSFSASEQADGLRRVFGRGQRESNAAEGEPHLYGEPATGYRSRLLPLQQLLEEWDIVIRKVKVLEVESVVPRLVVGSNRELMFAALEFDWKNGGPRHDRRSLPSLGTSNSR